MSALDAYDLKILGLLQENARLTFTEIGRRVHLTSPAIAERVRRLERSGVITGYSARVDLRALGYSFEAFIQLTVKSDAVLDAWAAKHPEVLAQHAITGDDCAILRVGIASPEHLQSLLKSLAEIGKTRTSIVLSSKLEDKPRKPASRLSASK